MLIKIIKAFFMGYTFTECVDCKHRKKCNHRVWVNPYDDCNYWRNMHKKNN